MIDSIRDRDVFVRLGRDGARLRVDSLWCTFLPDPSLSRAHVAYAIGRTFGPAVMRNRLRRRLRVLVRELELPAGWWLIGARPAAIDLSFEDLRRCVKMLALKVTKLPMAVQ